MSMGKYRKYKYDEWRNQVKYVLEKEGFNNNKESFFVYLVHDYTSLLDLVVKPYIIKKYKIKKEYLSRFNTIYSTQKYYFNKLTWKELYEILR